MSCAARLTENPISFPLDSRCSAVKDIFLFKTGIDEKPQVSAGASFSSLPRDSLKSGNRFEVPASSLPLPGSQIRV